MPVNALADSALIGSFSVGAKLTTTPQAAAHFQIGLGADWLDAGGLTLSARADARHDLLTSYALAIGWSGPGMLEGEGLPIGASLGPAFRLDADQRTAFGGRVIVALSLWYRRVTLELSASLYGGLGLGAPTQPITAATVAITIAPLAPARFR